MRRSNIVWGVILLFAGVAWILSSTELVAMDIMGSLFTLWPLFLIGAGVSMFFKREAHWMRVIIWVLVFAVIGGYAVYLGDGTSLEPGSENVIEMRSGVESAELQVSVGAADVDIGSTEAPLAIVNSNIKNLRTSVSGSTHTKINFDIDFNLFRLAKGRSFQADLNQSVPWSIELNTGAINGVIDARNLILNRCDLNTAACNLDIYLGNKQRETRIQCNTAVTTIDLFIPSGTGVRVQANGVATSVKGDGIDISKDDNTYKSENFDHAENTVVMEVNSATCDINVHVE